MLTITAMALIVTAIAFLWPPSPSQKVAQPPRSISLYLATGANLPSFQANAGARVEASSGQTPAHYVLGEGEYVWSGIPRDGMQGNLTASVTATGEGRGTLRLMGLQDPWPVYAECPVMLDQKAIRVSCAFTKPDDGLGLEIMFLGSHDPLKISIQEIEITGPGHLP